MHATFPMQNDDDNDDNFLSEEEDQVEGNSAVQGQLGRLRHRSKSGLMVLEAATYPYFGHVTSLHTGSEASKRKRWNLLAGVFDCALKRFTGLKAY